MTTTKRTLTYALLCSLAIHPGYTSAQEQRFSAGSGDQSLVYYLHLSTSTTGQDAMVLTLAIDGLDSDMAYQAALTTAATVTPGRYAWSRQTTPPQAPMWRMVMVHTSSATAYWQAVPQATSGYRLEASTDPLFSVYAASSTKATGLERLCISNLVASTTYHLRIASLGLDGATVYAQEVKEIVTAPAALKATPKPTATAIADKSADSLSVTWKMKSSGRVLYEIAVTTQSAMTPTNALIVDAWTDAQSREGDLGAHEVSGLAPNTLYLVSVRATQDGAVASELSSPAKTTTLAPRPVATSTKIYTSSMAVTWQSVPGGNGYQIEASTESSFARAVSSKTKDGSLERLWLKGLAPATTYHVRVGSLNSLGEPNWSQPWDASTLALIATTPPSPPVKDTQASPRGVYAYPVPWRPNNGSSAQGMTFTGLTPDAAIEIYDIAASFVTRLEPQGAATFLWNGHDEHGEPVSSGVYLWRVISSQGESTGKLMVIR